MSLELRSTLACAGLLLGAFAGPLLADNTPQTLPFTQNWTNTGLITVNNNWSGVPGIIGYRGDDLTTATGANPTTIVGDGTSTPVSVTANQGASLLNNTSAAGGVAEFDGIANPVIGLNGSGTADAPFILIHLNTTGKTSIRVQMNLRDLDSTTDNAAQPIAIQYRIGSSGNFSNVTGGYFADVTTGPSIATLVTAVDVTLPPAADNQPLVQVRVITANAGGNDEWVGIDDIEITGASGSLTLSPGALPGGTLGVAYSQLLTILNNADQPCAFGSTGTLPDGLTLNSATDTTITLSGTPTAANTFNFNITANCGSAGSINPAYTVIIAFGAFTCETSGVKTSTAIHTIQGSGAAAPLAGQVVEVEGIVVGDFQGTTGLRGFYLQEPDATWDADPATSEGIFVFDNAAGIAVSVGDRVRVRGTISEFGSNGTLLGVNASSSLTEIGSLTQEQVCSTGNPITRTTITLPVATFGDLERFEGMAVQIDQQLTITGNFNLGTFGQLDLAPALLYTPTASTGNSATWAAQNDLNRRSVIALDDASTLSNTALYPTIFPSGGLSASNTLRSGAKTTTPITGVLDDRFGEYRIQTLTSPGFSSDNARPAIAPILTSVGGRFRAISANVLNFFTTLGKRGAATATEFDQHKTKVVEALYAMNGDVYGLSEMQNYANGNASGDVYSNVPLQSLVTGLNCKASGMTPLCATPSVTPYAFIDTTALNNGTDAIRNAIVYLTAALTPVGAAATYYQNDTNRPTLAQTFKPSSGVKADQQTFTFVVNHFRSKGSACGGGQDDPFQGSCNGLRLNMAQNVITWLATNPTSDPAGVNRRLLLVGDFNAYFGEDPIRYFGTQGYANLINILLGASAYSYNFGSQAGYLDHALANGKMNALVKRLAEWHNNADEPSSLQALDSNLKSAAAQAAYYAPDPWAASDHDPIIIGFNTLYGDLNDDGVVNTQDQLLLTAAVGKPASQVDRRMDYDTDGVITLNDYRVWVTYYRAFIQ